MVKCLFGHHICGGEKFYIKTHHPVHRDHVLQLCICCFYGQITRLIDGKVITSGPIYSTKTCFAPEQDNVEYYIYGWIFSKSVLKKYPKLLQLFKDVTRRRQLGVKR